MHIPPCSVPRRVTGGNAMGMQVAYVIVTPYTIRKSRTGAVLARLMARITSELIAVRMFAPTRELAEAYARAMYQGVRGQDEPVAVLMRDYILNNFAPDADGCPHRVMLLVFRGENAVADVAAVTGSLRSSTTTGETVRDTFGDLVMDATGHVQYFEPAVINAVSPEQAAADLRLWSRFGETQPELLTGICNYANPEKVQQTLVLIKPDCWCQRSSRPGSIVDMFSRTGLRIIGSKLCQMSVAQTRDFYGPVKDTLCRKLSPGIGVRAREILQTELGCLLPPEAESVLAQHVGIPYAVEQFERIVEFMCGLRPSTTPEAEWQNPGRVRIMALIYEGEDAIAKIRTVLGPTDPTKAPNGTVRHEFGSNVMVNTAHASDSPESFTRESDILKLTAESEFSRTVTAALKECGL